MAQKILLGNAIPGFTLPSSQGSPLGLRDYRRRRHSVLFVARNPRPPTCRRLLENLALHDAEFQELRAAALAIVQDPPGDVADGPHPFRVLSNPDHSVRSLLLHGSLMGRLQAAVLVTGPFCKLFIQTLARPASEVPDAEELLDWAPYVDMRRPGCGAPEWPEVDGC